DYGLPARDAVDLNASPAIADYFERVAELSGDAKAAADWVRNQPSSVAGVPADRLAALIGLIRDGTITATIAKQVYALLEQDPAAEPAALIAEHGLGSIGDSDQLAALVDRAIAANPG